MKARIVAALAVAFLMIGAVPAVAITPPPVLPRSTSPAHIPWGHLKWVSCGNPRLQMACFRAA